MLFSLSVHSESVTLEFGIPNGTWHLTDVDTYGEINEDNNLFAVEYSPDDKWYIYFCTFDNTFYDKSMCIGTGYNLWSKYGLKLDALWGIVGGYKEGDLKSLCFKTTCAYISPRITYTHHLYKCLSVKPSLKGFGSAFNAAIGLECKF